MSLKFDPSNSTQIATYAGITAVVFGVLVMVGSFLSSADAPDTFPLKKTDVQRRITAMELAEWYIEGKRDFEVIDMRSNAEYEKGHIKNAKSCPVCHQNKEQAVDSLGEKMPNLAKKLVIYTRTGNEEIVLPRALSRQSRLYYLDGGFEAWEKEILQPGNNPDSIQVDDPQLRKKIYAISNYFLGKTDIEPPPTIEVKNEVNTGHLKRSFVNEGC